MTTKLYVDASPAFTAYVIEAESGNTYYSDPIELDPGETVNTAEYKGLINALEAFKKTDIKFDFLQIYMDSELVVMQMNDKYAIKNDKLKKLHDEAAALILWLEQWKEVEINIKWMSGKKNPADNNTRPKTFRKKKQ